MNRTRLVFLIATLFAPVAASAQADDATLRAIDAAVAAHVRKTLPAGRIMLEARIQRDEGWVDVRAPERTDAFAKALGATVGHHDAAYICMGLSPSSCSLRGYAAILAFAEPAFHGDSATVRFERLDATGSSQVPVSVRDLQVNLVRDGESWRVVNTDVLRES